MSCESGGKAHALIIGTHSTGVIEVAAAGGDVRRVQKVTISSGTRTLAAVVTTIETEGKTAGDVVAVVAVRTAVKAEATKTPAVVVVALEVGGGPLQQ